MKTITKIGLIMITLGVIPSMFLTGHQIHYLKEVMDMSMLTSIVLVEFLFLLSGMLLMLLGPFMSSAFWLSQDELRKEKTLAMERSLEFSIHIEAVKRLAVKKMGVTKDELSEKVKELEEDNWRP